NEAPEMLRFFYEEPKVTVALLANPKQKVTPELLPKIFKTLTEVLKSVSEKMWNVDSLKETMQKGMKRAELSQGQMLWPLRAALTGLPYSPGAYEVAVALGRKTTLKRLEAAAALLE
ncbi:MAG: hypothetical protein PHS73_00885, partial [Candidatus Peribacteraceae bacterium]|nr:hypothetical protein [Candidatus Peribacteraceae bacterium]